jgi:hypothetical protein
VSNWCPAPDGENKLHLITWCPLWSNVSNVPLCMHVPNCICILVSLYTWHILIFCFLFPLIWFISFLLIIWVNSIAKKRFHETLLTWNCFTPQKLLSWFTLLTFDQSGHHVIKCNLFSPSGAGHQLLTHSIYFYS